MSSVYMEVIECPRCVCGGYWAIWTSVLPFTYMGLGEKQAWLLAGLLCFTFLKTEVLKKVCAILTFDCEQSMLSRGDSWIPASHVRPSPQPSNLHSISRKP